MTEKEPSAGRGANASFCIPKAAIKLLIDAKADAVMIGAYLTLACFTDETGKYSSASVTAVSKAMSLNKERAKRAIGRLESLAVKHDKKKPATSTALLYSRDAWIKATGETLPDGPIERAQIRHVLPDFDEEASDRVWLSNGLVQGVGLFKRPLKQLKDMGDAAARLFLLMEQAVDMTGWCAVPPFAGPWNQYPTVKDVTVGPARIIHGQSAGQVMVTSLISPDKDVAFNALQALVGSGLFYEVVMVLNRNPVPQKFANGEAYGNVPDDAEPLYELDVRSLHGYKPEGEGGLGGLTARTVGELGHAVTAGTPETDEGYLFSMDGRAPGEFMGKYAAIVPTGYPAMIVGVYRPRFRVANPKNAGVKDAWLRIHENRRTGLEWIEQLRKARGLNPLPTAEQIAAKAVSDTPSKAIH